MLYTDSESIYAYNLIEGNSTAVSILSGLEKATFLAVDANRGYVFVAMRTAGKKDTIDRYNFKVDAGGKTAFMMID